MIHLKFRVAGELRAGSPAASLAPGPARASRRPAVTSHAAVLLRSSCHLTGDCRNHDTQAELAGSTQVENCASAKSLRRPGPPRGSGFYVQFHLKCPFRLGVNSVQIELEFKCCGQCQPASERPRPASRLGERHLQPRSRWSAGANQ